MIASSLNYIEDADGDNENSQYFDNIAGKVYKVNNLTGEILNVEESADHKGDEVVELLGGAVTAYLEEFFGDNKHVIGKKIYRFESKYLNF